MQTQLFTCPVNGPRFETSFLSAFFDSFGHSTAEFRLIHWHPHIHALVSEGVFLTDGTFMALPKLATEPFLKLWEQEVFKLLLAEGKITEEVVADIRGWQHSGFSVDQSVRVEAVRPDLNPIVQRHYCASNSFRCST